MRLYLLVPLAAVVAAGCASAQAKSADQPVLDVPPPPPHEIAIPAEPLEPVGEIPNPSAPPPTRTGRPPREVPPKPDTAKPEPKPDQPAAQPAAPSNPDPAPPLPPPPGPQLKTPQTADTGAAEKTVRTTITRARNTLKQVNYAPLSNERKKAYTDANLFLKQAEDALKEGNIVLAQAVATKAETLARELAGR